LRSDGTRSLPQILGIRGLAGLRRGCGIARGPPASGPTRGSACSRSHGTHLGPQSAQPACRLRRRARPGPSRPVRPFGPGRSSGRGGPACGGRGRPEAAADWPGGAGKRFWMKPLDRNGQRRCSVSTSPGWGPGPGSKRRYSSRVARSEPGSARTRTSTAEPKPVLSAGLGWEPSGWKRTRTGRPSLGRSPP